MNVPCRVEGCDMLAKCKGWCAMHYARWRRHGDLDRGRVEPVGSVHSSGYRYISSPGHPNASKHGKIAEHRLVMSEWLGRPLQPDENVHHINGDKLDNRLENLELWSTSQPRGQRVVDKLAWARQILETYEPVEGRL
jgi:hypothetical protein